MLGRKDYTRAEYDHAHAAVDAQLAGYRQLAAMVPGSSDVALAFETGLFNNMVLVLDRYFVHRLRVVTGKDCNPLNEVELLADSLMSNGGVLRATNVVKWIPAKTVLGLAVGDPILLTADDFERLAAAFFAELEAKFL
jgi:hypothetical protein